MDLLVIFISSITYCYQQKQ